MLRSVVAEPGWAGRSPVAALCRRTSAERPDLPISGLGSAKLAAEGKKAWLLIWDNAPWHVSKEVRQWVRQHNRQVKAAQVRGVRIVLCFLPSKSPWLNPIEPKWVHGKRRALEADRVLTADEVEQRV